MLYIQLIFHNEILDDSVEILKSHSKSPNLNHPKINSFWIIPLWFLNLLVKKKTFMSQKYDTAKEQACSFQIGEYKVII